MSRCERCNKMMFFRSGEKYCKECTAIIKIEKEQKLKEEKEKKRKEEERKKEEEYKRNLEAANRIIDEMVEKEMEAIDYKIAMERTKLGIKFVNEAYSLYKRGYLEEAKATLEAIPPNYRTGPAQKTLQMIIEELEARKTIKIPPKDDVIQKSAEERVPQFQGPMPLHNQKKWNAAAENNVVNHRRPMKQEDIESNDEKQNTVVNDTINKERQQKRRNNRRIDGITLSKEQSNVFEILEKTNDNYFITGKAGTGKSLILKYFKSKTKKEGVIVVAPTGIAAINVGGQTIHSFFNLSTGLEDTALTQFSPLTEEKREMAKQLKVIIIDEISMVRADIMDMIDAKLRYAKECSLPFGGCQIIAFGDLYQLPPIAKDAYEKAFLKERYGTNYFFGAPAVKATFKTLELQQVFRQQEPEFLEALAAIREGKATQEIIDFINTKSGSAPIPNKCLNLVLKKNTANEINYRELSLLPGNPVVYKATVQGENPPQNNEAPCEIELKLKPGAKIMFIRNDIEGKYRTGMIGKIVLAENNRVVVNNGKADFDIQKEKWQKFKYKYDKKTKKTERVEVGSIEQYPIILAYAITIHRSQGQTYDDVIINYTSGDAFAPGQTYVALSRCKSLSRLHLMVPLKIKDVFTDPQVIGFLKNSTVPIDSIIESMAEVHSEQDTEGKQSKLFDEISPDDEDKESALEAWMYVNEEDPELKFLALQGLAEKGNMHAQFELAQCYDTGHGTPKDESAAAFWYEKAAEQGHSEAQEEIAYDYLYGFGVRPDYSKSMHWSMESAKANNSKAMVTLGIIYEKGYGVPQNFEIAHQWYLNAAQLDNVDGMTNAGIDFLIGRGIKQSFEDAVYWNKKAAELGNTTAQYNLAQQYKNGDGIDQDFQEALRWYIQAAQGGHQKALELCQRAGII